jgi:hypothetical protein
LRWTGDFKCKIMLAPAALCALAAGSAMAQGALRIGVMNDMSGVTAARARTR